nr:hypothetical protein BaRGS_029133 [Batillaria attramentaria]
MVKADLREYREQLRQEFSAVLWGNSGQGPGSSASSARIQGGQGGGDTAGVKGGARDVGQFQSEFLRSLVSDAMEEVRDDIHHHIQSLHVEMVRQFHDFQCTVL